MNGNEDMFYCSRAVTCRQLEWYRIVNKGEEERRVTTGKRTEVNMKGANKEASEKEKQKGNEKKRRENKDETGM